MLPFGRKERVLNLGGRSGRLWTWVGVLGGFGGEKWTEVVDVSCVTVDLVLCVTCVLQCGMIGRWDGSGCADGGARECCFLDERAAVTCLGVFPIT
jgi:hypothetical protein